MSNIEQLSTPVDKLQKKRDYMSTYMKNRYHNDPVKSRKENRTKYIKRKHPDIIEKYAHLFNLHLSDFSKILELRTLMDEDTFREIISKVDEIMANDNV